jgi:hypothetical protein
MPPQRSQRLGTLLIMDHPVEPTATTDDFYDRLNDNPGRMVLSLGTGLLLITFCLTAFWWDDDAWFLLLCFILGPTALLALPRNLRDIYLAYRGRPALRINQLGFWVRKWSYLGWVSWSDVASIEIEGEKIHTLTVVLRDKEFAQLAGHDQAAIMLARLCGFLFFIDPGPNRLRLISSLQLASRWERLTTTLDPILVANGVPRSIRQMRS